MEIAVRYLENITAVNLAMWQRVVLLVIQNFILITIHNLLFRGAVK